MSTPVAVHAVLSFESERRYGIAAAGPAIRMWQLKTPPISQHRYCVGPGAARII
jgi:hypothetical protein